MLFWTRVNGKLTKVDRRGNRHRTDRVGSGHSPMGSPKWYGARSVRELYLSWAKAHSWFGSP